MTNDAVIESLRRMHAGRQLIPFVGAGLSIRLGLPSWDELIRRLAEDTGFDADVFRTHGDVRQLAQYSVLRKGIGPIRQAITEWFHTDDAEKRRRDSRAHYLLATGSFRRIYTTNFDEHIERACKDNGVHHHPVANIADLQQLKDPDATQIIKFHGSLADDESLVLGEAAYFKRLRFEDPMDHQLRADSQQSAFLFIGYSFQDPNIRYIWHDLAEQSKQLRQTTSGPQLRSVVVGAGYGEVQRELLQSFQIDLLDIDPTRPDDEVDEILERIVA